MMQHVHGPQSNFFAHAAVDIDLSESNWISARGYIHGG
jgi:hypothetical protein